MSGIGGAIGIFGSLYGGIQQQQAYNDAAGKADQQAGEAITQGEFDAQKQVKLANQKFGRMQAAYGASGVEINSGSAADVMMASHAQAEIDRQNILYGAQVKAINYENQASMDRTAGSNAIVASLFGAGGHAIQAYGTNSANTPDTES